MQGKPASKSMMRKVPERLLELTRGNLDELRAPMKDKELNEELRNQLDQAIEHCFRTPLERLGFFLTEFYANRAREEPGCKSLKDGEQIYALCLRFHTTTTKTAEEIHELGLAE